MWIAPLERTEAAGGPHTPPAAEPPPPRAWRWARRAALAARAALLHVAVPWAFVGFVLQNVPLKTAFEFDPDEGINLMKAVLYQDGHPLYREIWSDQPPLFTAMLAGVFHFAPASRYAARLLVVALAALLVWAFTQVLDLTLGTLPALAGAVLLAVSYRFARLSGSVMIGLPSLALAMTAVWFLLLYRRSPRRAGRACLLLGGVFFALSLQTKLFTISWLPLLVLAVVLPLKKKSPPLPATGTAPPDVAPPDVAGPRTNPSPPARWARGLVAPGLFLAALLTTFAAVGLYYHALDYGKLVEAQVSAGVKDVYQAEDNAAAMRGMWFGPGRDGDYLSLALFGVGAALVKLRWERLLPAGLLAASFLVLYYHKPIQANHQHLLMSVPLAWMAAAGVAPLTDFWRQRGFRYRRWPLRAAELALALGAAALAAREWPQIPPKYQQVRQLPHDTRRGSGADQNLIALLRKHAGGTRWVLTDRPIYAFEAGLRVPPPLAVMSRKRFQTRRLTSPQILEALETYKPEQVLLARFHGRASELLRHPPSLVAYSPAVYQYLAARYDRMIDDRGTAYYLLKTLPHAPPPRRWWD